MFETTAVGFVLSRSNCFLVVALEYANDVSVERRCVGKGVAGRQGGECADC